VELIPWAPSHSQHKKRTKRALPRNPWPPNRKRSNSAQRRRRTLRKPCC